MEDYLKSAVEIVTAQASARPMTEDEITSMIAKVAAGIQAAAGGMVIADYAAEVVQTPGLDPKKAIKEASIQCLVCGRNMKIITKKHLQSHDMTPAEYKERFGYKKTQQLACKALTRERRKKMQSMELWKKRVKKAD